MRLNFDFGDLDGNPPRHAEEAQWVPLQTHPVFASSGGSGTRAPKNLLAWDGASKLYFWDEDKQLLHRISVRLGEPEPSSIIAAYPSKVLQADMKLDFLVDKISMNREGSALLLSGSEGLCAMYLYGCTSTKEDTLVCRTVSVGPQVYSNGSNVIPVLQALWHPYSDTHIGILSSDSVLRLYDLSSDVLEPEQEYYLQPVEPWRSKNAVSRCPVDFAFGGRHLWDRFSVFILFGDGSIYILCPVVPFGSGYKLESLMEIYNDACTFGLKSESKTVVINSNAAISWLESTFPELTQQSSNLENFSSVTARPYALFDASLALQGPLQKVCHEGEVEAPAERDTVCEGHAVSFLCNLVSRDTILVTAWSGGQLQIDALADEIQPVWIFGSSPQLKFNSHGLVRGLAMICESISLEPRLMDPHQSSKDIVWSGHPPPVLRLAIIDLALPKKDDSSLISMFIDSYMPERIYCVHDGGIDSIVLHFLPFTSQASGEDIRIRSPSVHSVLSTCQGETNSTSPLIGFLLLSDSSEYSWVVVVTSSKECVLLEMRTWNSLLPVQIDTGMKSLDVVGEEKETDTPDIISRELLSGPKMLHVPHGSNLRSVSADSIEGRSALNQYFTLFHENYVEYAHKVYYELKHHGPHIKKIIDDHHGRLEEARRKISKVEAKQLILDERIDHAAQRLTAFEECLQRLRNLHPAHRKPLSEAEREFKAELDQFAGTELDALRSSIETLRARLRRYTESSNNSIVNQKGRMYRRNNVQDPRISQLRSTLEKLSLVNSENSRKVKALESALRSREGS